mgnify:CR=1 FL=1
MPHPGSDDPDLSKLPSHIAIIMDGNGRWARRRGLPRPAGHRQGVKAVRRVVESCRLRSVEALTLFAFSSENWRRPPAEVNLLMDLFIHTLRREIDNLHRNGVRLAFIGEDIGGGEIQVVEEENGVIHGRLLGPEHPLKQSKEPLTADFTLYVDPDQPRVKLVVGDEERILREGEWSDWVTVTFDLIPTQTVSTEARFYLRQVRPHLALYVSPLNLDPMAPALPISTPESWASELAAATGRYYTQGMPEDTAALAAGVFTREEFLAQAEIAGGEVLDHLRRDARIQPGRRRLRHHQHGRHLAHSSDTQIHARTGSWKWW